MPVKYAKPKNCPDCGWEFRETKTQWGTLRQCTGCTTRQWLDEHGDARGTPANAFVRRARMKAHAAFDRLWREGPFERGAAYKWLAGALKVEGPVHIGEMSTVECARVVELAEHQWIEVQHVVRKVTRS